MTDALAQGVQDMKPRTVGKWVEDGLLASSQFSKSTQRGRDPGVFPVEQRQLFRELLSLRERSDPKRIPHRALAPVVLLMWLLSDDIVPASQARRALRTYARGTGRNNAARRKESARLVVEQFAHSSATIAQRRAAQLLLEEGEESRRPEWDKLHSALTSLCSPWPSPGLPLLERGIGLPELPLTVTDALAIWVARGRVVALLEREQVSEAQLAEARALHRQEWASYEAQRSRLEERAMTPGFFARPDSAQAQALEQVSAFVLTLAGFLGILRITVAEARDGRLPPQAAR
ncbi:hypothetical protein [Streptomyces triculaminicus]|uniref:hypothetical protein n=1 Tax=Streptomyces triculaminicus TaxID=2816232 RepID=UPI0037909DD7